MSSLFLAIAAPEAAAPLEAPAAQADTAPSADPDDAEVPGVPAPGEAPAPEAPYEPLTVGIKAAPPFVVQHGDGTWGGISVMLWRAVSDDLNLEYRFVPVDLAGMLDGLTDGEIDVAVGALTVTAEREVRFDFTQPYFPGGLGIAVRDGGGNGLSLALLQRLFSRGFLQAVGALVGILLVAGALVWVFERRDNEEFSGSLVSGLGQAFWWSAVTMTTVGYGDKSPRTLGGRLVALVWMFASVIIISSFTAAISSALTVGSLDEGIEGPEDLDGVEIGTVDASTSDGWARSQRLDARAFPTPVAALEALEAGKIDAVVYDAPVLRHHVLDRFTELRVLERTFQVQYYAFGLREGLAVHEELDRVLLERLESDWWRDVLYDRLRQQE